MVSSRATWRTLHATGREWRDNARLTHAFERGSVVPPGGGAAVYVASRSTDALAPNEEDSPWSLWLQEPDLRRSEFFAAGERTVTVFHGDTWWATSDSRPARTNVGRSNYRHWGASGRAIPVDRFHPALCVDGMSTGRLLGREVTSIRCTVRVTGDVGRDHRLTRSLAPLWDWVPMNICWRYIMNGRRSFAPRLGPVEHRCALSR